MRKQQFTEILIDKPSFRFICLYADISEREPCISTQSESGETRGTMDGLGDTMVCPKSAARLYPSPVDPVRGYETPPVASTTALHRIVLPAATTPVTVLSSTINRVTSPE